MYRLGELNARLWTNVHLTRYPREHASSLLNLTTFYVPNRTNYFSYDYDANSDIKSCNYEREKINESKIIVAFS